MNDLSTKNYLQETIEMKESIEAGFIFLGEHLRKIRNEELWRNGKYDSWPDFLAVMKMSEGQASKLISVYETYIVKLKLKPEFVSQFPQSILYSMREIATSKEKVEELAKERREDIEERIRIARHGECERHIWKKMRFCEKCNKRELIYD